MQGGQQCTSHLSRGICVGGEEGLTKSNALGKETRNTKWPTHVGCWSNFPSTMRCELIRRRVAYPNGLLLVKYRVVRTDANEIQSFLHFTSAMAICAIKIILNAYDLIERAIEKKRKRERNLLQSDE